MKVAITGHTSGIGKELFTLYPDALGFSRTNGYDIRNPLIRRKIVEEIVDCDMFVNNAYAGFYQTELFFNVWNEWKEKDRIIINMGSRASDNTRIKYPWPEYAVHKAALEAASNIASAYNTPCKVINVKPGTVDTPMVKHHVESKMDAAELASNIKQVVELPKTFWPTTITMHPR
jgi:NADP-dependent 3-hydroxy acid dehydrogenase YdfG